MKTHNFKLKIHFTKHLAHEFSLIGGGDGMDYGAYQCNGVALICHTEGKKEGQTLQEDGCHFE